MYSRPGLRKLRPARLQRARLFFAGWGQMLTYIITVAISAFFVPHYLAVFSEPLREPRRHHRRHRPDRRPCCPQHQGHPGVVPAQPHPRDRRPRDPGALGRRRSRARLQSRRPDRQHRPRRRPDLGDFALGIALGMIAYTGIETISNMSEEAIEPERSIPRGAGYVVLAVIGLYALLPPSPCRRCRSRSVRTGTRPSWERPSPAIRCSGSSRTSASAPASPMSSASTSASSPP